MRYLTLFMPPRLSRPQRLGQRVLAQVMGFVPEPSDITVVKWREACWKLLTYAGLSIYGVFVLAGEDFVLDTGNLWQGWPRQNHSCVCEPLNRPRFPCFAAALGPRCPASRALACAVRPVLCADGWKSGPSSRAVLAPP